MWAWSYIGNQFSLEEWKPSWRNPKCYPLSELLLLNLLRGPVEALIVAIGAQQDSNRLSWKNLSFFTSGTHQFPTDDWKNSSIHYSHLLAWAWTLFQKRRQFCSSGSCRKHPVHLSGAVKSSVQANLLLAWPSNKGCVRSVVFFSKKWFLPKMCNWTCLGFEDHLLDKAWGPLRHRKSNQLPFMEV